MIYFKYLHAIKEYYQRSPQKTAFILSAIMMCLLFLLQSARILMAKEPMKTDNHSMETLADKIPEGKQLIPLDLVNNEALEKMVSESAWVDLYAMDLNQNKKQKILSQALLIRTDLQQFAVLLNDDQEKKIPQLQQPVFAVLRGKPRKLTKEKNGKIQRVVTIKGEEI